MIEKGGPDRAANTPGGFRESKPRSQLEVARGLDAIFALARRLEREQQIERQQVRARNPRGSRQDRIRARARSLERSVRLGKRRARLIELRIEVESRQGESPQVPFSGRP